MKLSSILGLNARSRLFSYKYGSAVGKKIARSKILTKRTLTRNGVSEVPEIYKIFKTPRDVFAFDWTKLPPSFALKPSKGLGGEGIIVIKKRTQDENGWITTARKLVTREDLKLHVLDILEGAYSVGNVPDVAFCEEYVARHKAFRKLAFRGTPDVRIIVFNKVPVMAMLRLPTRESGGRANLHQGAIGTGVDIPTGITTRAVWYGELIKHKPETKRKLNGIKIPHWTKILELAVRGQEASGLGYIGVDIVLHPSKGPLILEINSSPGLQVQLANMEGLRKRLERVEDLEVRDAEHGVRIAKALFAGPFVGRVKNDEGIKTVNVVEEIKIRGVNGEKVNVTAKVDTGAWTTSIDKKFAKDLGIFESNRILWYKRTRNSLGLEDRPVIAIVFWLGGKRIKTVATVADRSNLAYKILVGRSDLKGFVVNP